MSVRYTTRVAFIRDSKGLAATSPARLSSTIFSLPLKSIRVGKMSDPCSRVMDSSTAPSQDPQEAAFDPPLWIQRRAMVLGILDDFGVHSVLDLGCSEGSLLQVLLKGDQFTRVAVSSPLQLTCKPLGR